MSDPERAVAGKYQALKGFGRLVQRTVYVIGPHFTIIFAEQGIPADSKILEAIQQHRRQN